MASQNGLKSNYLSAKNTPNFVVWLRNTITGGILPKELWARMKTKLIDERNAGMANGLISNASENSVFAAVGASHLGGEGGILNRLVDAGYKISPVTIK